jgi:ABC-type sulfate transport system permease subunit
MEEINLNQVWASNLLRISALMIAVSYFISPPQTHFELMMISVFINMVIAIVLAYFARKGYQRPKWILLTLLVINLPFSVVGVTALVKQGLLYAVLSQSVNIIQVVALILLFLPAKKSSPPSTMEEIE